jgi:hypothetical protein
MFILWRFWILDFRFWIGAPTKQRGGFEKLNSRHTPDPKSKI